MNQTHVNPPSKSRMIKKVITVLLIIFLILITSLVLVVGAFVTIGMSNSGLAGNIITNTLIEAVAPPIRERTNVLILGTDDGLLTDTIMVVSFNSITGRLDIISIPRDTYVVMPSSRVNSIRASGRNVPLSGQMKINEVHAYAGKHRGIEYALLQVEELLNIDLHYYVRVDLEAFRYIVDAVGGIEFYVPQRMFYRGEDILIDLQPGWQILDSRKAEQLVRFRGYPEADLQRIRVQQKFLKEGFQQVINRDNIINNALSMITATLNYIDTNFKIAYAPQYLRYINMINENNIFTHTIPNMPEYINGISYAVVNEAEINEFMHKVLFGANRGEIVSSKSKRIKVLNGSDIPGAAFSGREVLINNGFSVETIGNYYGEREKQTRIFIRNPRMGEDIRGLFSGSRIVLDSNMNENYDIIVVIGGGQTS